MRALGHQQGVKITADPVHMDHHIAPIRLPQLRGKDRLHATGRACRSFMGAFRGPFIGLNRLQIDRRCLEHRAQRKRRLHLRDAGQA